MVKITKIEHRICQRCNKSFAAERKGTRPRWYCDDCRRQQRREQYAHRPRVGHRHNAQCQYIEHAIGLVPTPTLEEIAKPLGVTRERVRQVIARHGWSKPTVKARLVKGGSLCSTCGQRVPIHNQRNTETTLAAWREHNATHVNPHRVRWEKRAIIVAAYLADWKIADIAKEVGLARPEQVYHALIASGVRPNRGHGWPRRLGPDGILHRAQDLK
jgi:AraC-like DNA-binding protein